MTCVQRFWDNDMHEAGSKARRMDWIERDALQADLTRKIMSSDVASSNGRDSQSP
jgi:hypothetical protein